MMKILKERSSSFAPFVFLFENMFATVVPTDVFWKDSIAAPHFFIIVLCFITVYYSPVKDLLRTIIWLLI